jgi:hypothetical protein
VDLVAGWGLIGFVVALCGTVYTGCGCFGLFDSGWAPGRVAVLVGLSDEPAIRGIWAYEMAGQKVYTGGCAAKRVLFAAKYAVNNWLCGENEVYSPHKMRRI